MNTKKSSQFLLKSLTFLAKSQPKIESAGNSRFDLIFCEYTTGIRDGDSFLPRLPLTVSARAETCVSLTGVFAGEAKDFLA